MQLINSALAFVRQLASAIEKALKMASSIGAKRQHIHSCSLVRAKKFYGFHPCEQLFIKIVLYYPQEVPRLSTLLLGGGILNRCFQPHESHVPYLLQVLIDHNLAGMGHLHLSNIKFRQPIVDNPTARIHTLMVNFQRLASKLVESMNSSTESFNLEFWAGSPTTPSSSEMVSQTELWYRETVPAHWIWSNLELGSQGQGMMLLEKQSTCELEGDASVEDILNRQELLYIPLARAGPEVKMVQSLIPMWEEHAMKEAGVDDMAWAPNPSYERHFQAGSYEQEFRRLLGKNIDDLEQWAGHREGCLGSKVQSGILHDQSNEGGKCVSTSFSDAHISVNSTDFFGKETVQKVEITENFRNYSNASPCVSPPCEQDILLKCTQAANSKDKTISVGLEGVNVLKPCSQRSKDPAELVNEEIIKHQLTQSSQETDQEAVELLRWMVSSQQDGDAAYYESDNEKVVDETSWSQIFQSADEALAKVILDYENSSQQECQEIIDCIDERAGQEEQGLGHEGNQGSDITADLERAGKEQYVVSIPQFDGSCDEELPSSVQEMSGKAGENEKNIEIKWRERKVTFESCTTQNAPSSISRHASLDYPFVKEVAMPRSAWGPLCLSNREDPSAIGGEAGTDVGPGASESHNQSQPASLLRLHGKLESDLNEGQKEDIDIVSKAREEQSLRDMMRRKRKRRHKKEMVASEILPVLTRASVGGISCPNGCQNTSIDNLHDCEAHMSVEAWEPKVSEKDQPSQKKKTVGKRSELHSKYKYYPQKRLDMSVQQSSKYGLLPLVKATVLDSSVSSFLRQEKKLKTEEGHPSDRLQMDSLGSLQVSSSIDKTVSCAERENFGWQVRGESYDVAGTKGGKIACNLGNTLKEYVLLPSYAERPSIDQSKERSFQEVHKELLLLQDENRSVQEDKIESKRLNVVHLSKLPLGSQQNAADGDLERENSVQERTGIVPGTSFQKTCDVEVGQDEENDWNCQSLLCKDHDGNLPNFKDSQSKSRNEVGGVPLVYCKKPPTTEQLRASFDKYNLIPVEHGTVFYGIPQDIPDQPAVMAGLVFEVKSREVAHLPPYQFGQDMKETSSTSRAYVYKDVWGPLQEDDSTMGIPLHFQNDGTISFLLTPAKSPPSLSEVRQWLWQENIDNVGKSREVKDHSPREAALKQGANCSDNAVGTQSGWPQSEESQCSIQFFRPASPKYDEKHVLTYASSDCINSPVNVHQSLHFQPPFSDNCPRPAQSHHLVSFECQLAVHADREIFSSSTVYGMLPSKFSAEQQHPLIPVPERVPDGERVHLTSAVGSASTMAVNLPGSQHQHEMLAIPDRWHQSDYQIKLSLPLSYSTNNVGDRLRPESFISERENLFSESISQAERQTVQIGLNANIVFKGMPDRSPRQISHLSFRKKRDVSQITAPTSAGEQDTPVSQAGFRDPASTGGGQQILVMSVEVYAETRGDLRPDPRYDSINCIVLVLQNDDSHAKSARQTIILLRGKKTEATCRNIDAPVGCEVVTLKDECTLLQMFVLLVQIYDPDMLVGWEIQGFSLGLLAERSANLGIGLLKQISRTSLLNRRTALVMQNADGNQEESGGTLFGRTHVELVGVSESIIEDEWGRTHGSGIHVGGRIVLNLWRIMCGEIKLGIYTLEAVAEAVLKRKVPLIPWRTLTRWFLSGPGGKRFRCIEYFVERARLNLQIMDQLDLVNRTSELARVFGIDFFSVLSRGSQYRVESMMLRLAHTQNFLLISPSRQQVASQPAMQCLPLVMEPESRFYTDPVVVLDFQSLYPSMIIAYNLCFSTCLGKIVPDNPKVLGVTSLTLQSGTLEKLKDCMIFTPNGVMFTPPEVCPGVLPRLLQEILSTRIMVKQAMKKLSPSQKILQRVLNARQFALKLISNVTYGYTAAGFSGRMPCAEIADSIVQSGRYTLETAINFVNSNPQWKAHVVYGDTDSMFVLLKGRTREEAFKIGEEIASAVTSMNPHPVTLKMEKVYHPCVLLTKKRYVGYSYESPRQVKPTFDAKGIETIRRDSCGAVAKTLERSLRILFETHDLSQVKMYLQRQWGKILSGRISVKDFVFAKEVRLGSYSARASVLPPAAIVATKAMSIDPRAEPRYGERIPYVVVHGEPGVRLADIVVDPHTLVNVSSTLRLHDTYYITKQIIPALQRVFGLVGVDMKSWYNDMPRLLRPPMTKRPFPTAVSPLKSVGDPTDLVHQKLVSDDNKNQSKSFYRRTIDHYYLSQHCTICGELIHASSSICDSCSVNEMVVTTAILGRASRLEREFQHLQAVCRHCGGGDGDIEGISCISLDCSVFFERIKVQKELKAAVAVSNQCGFTCAFKS